MIRCPYCESARIHQSKRSGILERVVLAILFIRPFRCEACDSRFFRMSYSATPNASPSAF
jgi:DNA-directed RNA polymerase subunit RPC12/RpoP